MTSPDQKERIEEIARLLIEAESGVIAHDLAHHLGDQIHDLLVRTGMLARTTGGVVATGALAAAAVLNDAVEFGRRSMDGDADDEAIITAAAWRLFADVLRPGLRQHLLSQETSDGVR